MMTKQTCLSSKVNLLSGFFFFQEEDGIRDYKLTGVQTCALPIYAGYRGRTGGRGGRRSRRRWWLLPTGSGPGGATGGGRRLSFSLPLKAELRAGRPPIS